MAEIRWWRAVTSSTVEQSRNSTPSARARIQLELEHFEEAVRDFKSAEEAAEAENAAIGEQGASAGETRQAEVLLKRSETKDYYKILNVSRDCSDSDIKEAYRRESLNHHPDKGGDAEKFKPIGEANAVLSDSQRRGRYDAGGDEDGSNDSGLSMEDMMGGGMHMNLAEMLAQMLGAGGGRAGLGFGGPFGGGFGGHGHGHSFGF
ncbi:hypothetical protein FRC12_000528 [Ceratobasidium sp. 428]|nr:hypothetical protein FRC12_000528 [Ceratobasidium sp. 428]